MFYFSYIEKDKKTQNTIVLDLSPYKVEINNNFIKKIPKGNIKYSKNSNILYNEDSKLRRLHRLN